MCNYKRMTNKNLLVSFAAFLVAVLVMQSVVAAELNVVIDDVVVNDISLDSVGSSGLVGYPGETVPVRVKFTSNEDVKDVKVKLWIEGYKNDIIVSTDRFDVLSDTTYSKRFSLTLPTTYDLKDLDELLTLHVLISTKTADIEEEYTLHMQKESYVFNVLSVESPSRAVAGDILAIDVVLKNQGTHELEDAFVIARISELGIQRKVYFGDLNPNDECVGFCNEQDARERRVYLNIPSDVKSGEYELEVVAYNYDNAETVRKLVSITGLTTSDSDDEDDRVIIDGSERTSGWSNSLVILTVILVIIFVVLLIILVVLLTKKPEQKEEEELGETSYY